MLFFVPPSAPIMPTRILTQSQNKNKAAEMSTYGVCSFATTPFMGGNDLDPSRYLLNVMPSPFKDLVKGNSLSSKEWSTLTDWEERISIKIKRQPMHGKASSPGLIYFANKGYIGKDKIEAVVSGSNLSGGKISVRLIYFINVVSAKNFNSIADNYRRSLWKYCHSRDESWKISHAPSGTE